MDKFGSVIDRMNMIIRSKFLNSLRIKTRLLKRLQRVINVDGATHSQKDGVEGNGGSLQGGADALHVPADAQRLECGMEPMECFGCGVC